MILLLILACAPALTGGTRDRVSLAVPSGWELTRNHRFLGTDNVAMKHGDAAISVLVVADNGLAQSYPLDVVASVRALSWGRKLGVQNNVVAEHSVSLDGREAYAVTGLRQWRTTRIGYTMVVTRTCGRLAEVVLHAPPDSLDFHTRDWGTILESLHIVESPGWVSVAGPLFVDEGWRHARDCQQAEAS